MPQTPTGSPDEFTLRITPGPAPGMMSLRVSPQHFDELLELVRAEGLAASRAAEFSAEQILQIVSVVLGSAGGLTALSSAVKTFLTRHKDKTAKFGTTGELLEAKGFSAKDIGRIMAQAAEQQRKQEEAMRRRGISADGQVDSQQG